MVAQEKEKLAFNQFYENMRLVDSGDIVFSFYSSRIQKLGVVMRPAVTSQRPSEFGKAGKNWAKEGWLVPVEWHDVPTLLRPSEIIPQLRPVLPKKYSPLNRETGSGFQAVYLAAVPEKMAAVLLKHIGIEGAVLSALKAGATDDGKVIASIEDRIAQEIQNNTDIDETERVAVGKARRGQGRFRANVLSIETKCRVTGVADPRLLKLDISSRGGAVQITMNGWTAITGCR